MVDEYQIDAENGSRDAYKEVHSWRPPCSCGVELGEALGVGSAALGPEVVGDVHFWRPPCSCGVSLDEVL